MNIHKKHIIITCDNCNIEFILINNDNDKISKILNNMKCPFTKCTRGNLIVKSATDDYKECMDHKNIYIREKGRMKQVK